MVRLSSATTSRCRVLSCWLLLVSRLLDALGSPCGRGAIIEDEQRERGTICEDSWPLDVPRRTESGEPNLEVGTMMRPTMTRPIHAVPSPILDVVGLLRFARAAYITARLERPMEPNVRLVLKSVFGTNAVARYSCYCCPSTVLVHVGVSAAHTVKHSSGSDRRAVS